MSDLTFWKMEDPDLGTLPVWVQPVGGDEEERGVDLCEASGDPGTACAPPLYRTGVAGDLSVLYCAAHVHDQLTQISEAEYDRLAEEMR